jgi:glycogen phosphorylase
VRWVPRRMFKGLPYNTPLQGYRVNTCNTLRLMAVLRKTVVGG